MGIGFTVYIEFAQEYTLDDEETRVQRWCATPGGVFFFHHHCVMEIFGLPIKERVRRDHPFGLRGFPESMTPDIIRNHYLVISRNASSKLDEKKKSRKFSFEDKEEWKCLGLQFWPIVNKPAYGIDLQDDEELYMNPGCECPSWLTVAELKQVFTALDVQLEAMTDHAEKYNASIFRWVFSLGEIYGDDLVRMIYWFDSLGVENIRKYSPVPPQRSAGLEESGNAK